MRSKIGLWAIIFFSSCSQVDDPAESLRFSETDFPQHWKLSTINTGLSGETLTSEELSVRESYIFNQNGTFSKEFKDDKASGKLNGTYALISVQNREFLKLTYELDVDSLSYCSKLNVENLLISENKEILSNGGCLAFDGPALHYERFE